MGKTFACHSGKSWGINKAPANASQPGAMAWQMTYNRYDGYMVSETENWIRSEPIIGHLSGISQPLTGFLRNDWKMQIFAGPRSWKLKQSAEKQQKTEKNRIETKSKSGQQPWNWILRFIAKQNAAVACQMCRSGMSQESVLVLGYWYSVEARGRRLRDLHFVTAAVEISNLSCCPEHCALVMLKKRSSIYFN